MLFRIHWPGMPHEVITKAIRLLAEKAAAAWRRLKRIDQRIRHQHRVVHAVFLGKFELPCLAHDAVEIAPHVEHTRQIIDERLEDRIVGLDGDSSGLSPVTGWH